MGMMHRHVRIIRKIRHVKKVRHTRTVTRTHRTVVYHKHTYSISSSSSSHKVVHHLVKKKGVTKTIHILKKMLVKTKSKVAATHIKHAIKKLQKKAKKASK